MSDRPKPWPAGWAEMDLRWWADRVRMGRAERMPSRRKLQAAWGWSTRQVTKLVKDEGR